jgi:adenylosuccinate synthase
VIGVTKAYVTRVGEGPFPDRDSRLHSADLLRARGQEYGAVTGQSAPLRLARSATSAVQQHDQFGTEWLVVTKMDVMDECAEIPVCTGYKINGKLTDVIPADMRGLQRHRTGLHEIEGLAGLH